MKKLLKNAGYFRPSIRIEATTWHTPETGGKVGKHNLTQFGRAMKRLGIETIATHSPQARRHSECMFCTHQERLPKELALADTTGMATANQYVYLPAFNAEFMQSAAVEGSAFALDRRAT